jgi:hypothetical protein
LLLKVPTLKSSHVGLYTDLSTARLRLSFASYALRGAVGVDSGG